ncbi:glucose-1-phosphate adenylyltransferase subunit GlgD [Clostridium chauvoei]|uniref:Glucose-1-phosphate adenylyltransferase subunit GlgD n=2 Tax=Clostridium chauvoei TaxID=46867 RepID=A0ABD4RL60_9CLOT|nr:glucose-1-phosphate adenylyltransferase subunit GlgD [Clostridium chauvoei]ATD54026.1 glucose-1-phosphate adenylyltransferase subunit GlgD [Clostridium chauvoei]ATD58521.1 glucose-1-phosphate adenylyltransferase subunit GlgD [Clostridium chauvoei]MBX7281810.1 glucose-1-phosphate adenylyltransferase subunit GlgD [Clostridium chauvoei]MBX7284331.1 glucose-1-phosphate adenylyltransferase subunit GlgD [Clostridium chauvoei]MBX7286839.1 glucose-1-phosphate adenylyltransferase subunit GlgD [Clost
MNNCLGIINLDENESRMGELVRYRTLASVPIAARYRIIDFVLSNMANSGIEGIGIFTKNKSRSLINHLTNGRPWDLHRKKDGLRVFNFGDYAPEYDDVHNFADNIEFIKQSRRDYILIAPSHMICNIDYNEVIKQHKKNNKDVTIVYKKVNDADKKFIDCDVLNINEEGRVISIGENIGREENANISMEMYIMKTDVFINIVYDSIKSGMYRKIKDFISANLDKIQVDAFEFKGYLACINSLKAYFDTNMDLLSKTINKELFYENKPIYTKSQDEAPTQYTKISEVSNSIVANGSYIEGTVKNCIIGRRVHISEGTIIENCVIMQNTVIGPNVKMDKVIADKGTLIDENQSIKGTNNHPVTIQKSRAV